MVGSDAEIFLIRARELLLSAQKSAAGPLLQYPPSPVITQNSQTVNQDVATRLQMSPPIKIPKTDAILKTEEKPQTSVTPDQTKKLMQLSIPKPDPVSGDLKGTNGIPGTFGTSYSTGPVQNPTNNLKNSPTKVNILHRGQMTGGLPPQQSAQMQHSGGTVQFSELKARLTQPLKTSVGEATSAKRPKTIGEKLNDFKKAEERLFPECSMCNCRHEPGTVCSSSPRTSNVVPDIIRFYTG